MEIMIDVAARYGGDIPQRLSDLLAGLFEAEPHQWPLPMRLDVANRLAANGVSVPWCQETLDALEVYAATEDVSARLRIMEDVARGYAQAGQAQRAQEVALGLIPMGFGVGYRKDYQFQYWVTWLGRAVAESGGERFVEEALWLARLLKAAAPMSERKYPAGAADLPPAVVPAAPLLAVRVFEYLVRQGAVSHTGALASLMSALLTHTTAAGTATVDLAADITAELLAPAANSAYPKLAESLVAAAERTAGIHQARRLAESVASRTDKYALLTSRAQWRQGLGIAATDPANRQAADATPSQEPAWSDDTLELSDGRRLTRVEVASQIRSVGDIVALRRQESPESWFSWAETVAQQELTNSDIRTLEQAFNDESPASVAVRVSVAESAEHNGDRDTALRLASTVLARSSRDGWSYGHRATSRRAAAIAVRLGGPSERVTACRDLTRHATSDDWVPRQLLPDLHSIVEALAPDLDSASTWPHIRFYLEGMAETLDLGSPGDLKDHGCRWWLPQPAGDPRAAGGEPTREAALAELAVGHISHPTWLVRDAAIRVVGRALAAGNSETAEALARFAQAATAHDILESAGRCLATARTVPGHVTPDSLQPLDGMLAAHPSRVLRDLASDQTPRRYRPLRQAYNLVLPPPTAYSIGSQSAFLEPHLEQYRLLAACLGLDLETLLGVAARYASQSIDCLPEEKAIRNALSSASMRHSLPSTKITASREAFGRVLADLADARLLDETPQHMLHMFRTIDVDALTRTPSGRPSAVPEPPEPEQSRTTDRWHAATESRIDEHVAAASAEGETLIAARSKLTARNPYHLSEELVLAATTGTAPPEALFARRKCATLDDLTAPTQGRLPDPGEPLVVENIGWEFHQRGAEWLSFRPDIAAALAWTPDPNRPGRWHTARGDLAVKSVWWVDGWWGQADMGMDDTAAEGHAVILTAAGFTDASTAIGEITTHFELTRDAQDDRDGTVSVTATRIHNLRASTRDTR